MHARIHTRRPWLLALAALAVSLALPPSVGAAQDTLVAIVHPSNSVRAMSESEVRNIYLGRVTFWGNSLPVHAYMRPATSAAARAFLRVLGMTPSRYRHHWQSRQLSGQGVAPSVVADLAELLTRIAGNRGAVGFALATEASASSTVKFVPIR